MAVLHDTAVLQPDLQCIHKEAEGKLQAIASTPTTEQNSDLLEHVDNAAAGTNELATSFIIASLNSLNVLLTCEV